MEAKDIMNPTAIEVYHSSFGSGVIEILIGILVAALMAKEYSQGTIKNFLAYGKKREEFYLAKFIAIVVGVAIILADYYYITNNSITIMNGWGQAFEILTIIRNDKNICSITYSKFCSSSISYGYSNISKK